VKTISLKKVSAVAVAALAIGTFTAIAPANAAEQNVTTTKADSISLAQGATNTNVAGTVVSVNFGVKMVAAVTPTAGDTLRYSGYLSTYPAGGFKTVQATLGTCGQATAAGAVTCAAATYPVAFGAASELAVTTSIALKATAVATTAVPVTASSTVGSGSFTFTPAVAGTYVMTVWQDNDVDGIVDIQEPVQTASITVTAASGLLPTASVVRMGPAAAAVTQGTAGIATTQGVYTTTVDAIPRAAVKTVSTNIGQVAVILVNDDGTAAGNLHTVTADITGAGLVLCNASDAAAAGTVRSSAFPSTGTNNVVVCHISADGTAGEGTVTISVTDSVSGVKTKIGSESFYSWGTVAKIAIDTKPFTVGKAGSPTGGASTTRVIATEIAGSVAGAALGLNASTITTPAFTVAVTDSSGKAANITAAGVPTVTSGTPSVVSGGTCALDGGQAAAADADFKSSTNGVGIYNCKFDTVSGAASGAKATLTLSTLDPADPLGVAKLTATLDVTVGGSISTETVAFDKTAYAPGEAMTITMTAKDSAGNPVFDGAASPALTFTKSVGGTAPAAGIYVGGKKSTTSTKGVASVFAPAVSGAFSALGTSGNAALTAISVASSVTDANAGLLTQIDALNAKIVALNALIAKIMKKLGVK
jgi:hypothetical protein